MSIIELEDAEYYANQDKNLRLQEEYAKKIDLLRKEIDDLSMDAEIPETLSQVQTTDNNNDPETMIRSLQIMHFMMQSNTITSMSSTLRGLMDSIALPLMNVNILIFANNNSLASKNYKQT